MSRRPGRTEPQVTRSMAKARSTWFSPRLQHEVSFARWGSFGRPVLLFPTAGGDCEECERMLMIRALAPLIDAGRIKVYSPDSVAGRVWIRDDRSPQHKAWLQNQYDAFVYEELVPAIRTDCGTPDIEIISAGASIGALNAVASLIRHPDAFSLAIGMSGTYNLTAWMDGVHTLDLHYFSPIHFLPELPEGDVLRRLRQRLAILAVGEGRWDKPGNSWELAAALGRRGVPNRVDLWGPDHDHDWPTWREMLPKYLGELT